MLLNSISVTNAQIPTVFLVENLDTFFNENNFSEKERQYFIKKTQEKGNYFLPLPTLDEIQILVMVSSKKAQKINDTLEIYRNLGHELVQWANKEQHTIVQLCSHFTDTDLSQTFTLAFLEGALLSQYQFNKYKSENTAGEKAKKQATLLQKVDVWNFDKNALTKLQNIINSVHITRNLVNEPANFLNAVTFAEEIQKLGKTYNFHTEIWDKAKIKAENMNGLLAVNQGSSIEPRFIIMEHKPKNARNTKPVVLIGKGVTFDTGGISLKPTESMFYMKIDMAGAGVVVGAMCAIAQNNVPVHVIGLIPSTDNRISVEAFTPGDIITMRNGKTVEMLNSDAEGRMILADALDYAKSLSPIFTVDLATLTGSAMRAVGYESAVIMGNTTDENLDNLVKISENVAERLVKFPLADDYEEHLKSDIADFSNLGHAEAGSISAGRFLLHFAPENWCHIDLAAPSYLHAPRNYRPKGGTGFGVRILYQFLENGDFNLGEEN